MSTPSLSERLNSGTLVGSWTLDPQRSSVRLKSRSMWGLAPVKGTFSEISGSAAVSPEGDVTGTLQVASASIDTKNAKRDKHLRSADFFDSENYPAIVFEAQSVQPSAQGLTVIGTVTVRDRKLPLTFEAAVSVPDPGEVRLEAEVRIDRAEFGLTWNGFGASMLNTLAIQAVFAHR